MGNLGQKKPCEDKKILVPLINVNFKVQDTTKSIKQKRCGLICLNDPNFLNIYENHFLSYKNSKKTKII